MPHGQLGECGVSAYIFFDLLPPNREYGQHHACPTFLPQLQKDLDTYFYSWVTRTSLAQLES